MKSFLLIFMAVCLSLSACQHPHFTLKGKAGNINNAVIELKNDHQKWMANIIDGQFFLKNLVEHPDFYTLSLIFDGLPVRKHEFLFYLEPGDYQLDFDPKNLKSYPKTESSSPIQQEVSAFYQHKGSKYDYIIQHPQSVLSAYFLSTSENSITENPEKYHKAFQQLEEEVKNSKYGKQAKVLIESIMGNKPGSALPKIHGLTPDNSPLDPSVLKGKLSIIVFWATYNRPSRQDIPQLKKWYDLYHDKGLEIVSISLDKSEKRWKSTIDSYQMNWLHVNDFKGKYSENINSFNNLKVPYYILISPELKIIEHGVPFNSIPIYINDFLNK